MFLHAQTNINTLFYPSYTKLKKIKKISFFIIKSLKIHSTKNICRRAFCLASNERELSNLLILSISLEASIGQSRPATSSQENENPVSLEYVKKSKTDFDFFRDNYSIDDGVPGSSPNRFSNEIGLLICK